MAGSGGGPVESDWVEQVHGFWFQAPERWFGLNPSFDAEIRRRFAQLYESLKSETPTAMSPRRSVAAVIVLDQFPRNMFRGTAQEFATDAQALSIARSALAAGVDSQVRVDERLFLYMPFMRSEDPADQKRSVELFASLDVPEVLKAAKEHKRVIDTFGRFPHRNKVLGRTSTSEEIAFLRTGTAAQ
jgi:uncharacterized protein (DUF924 family)